MHFVTLFLDTERHYEDYELTIRDGGRIIRRDNVARMSVEHPKPSMSEAEARLYDWQMSQAVAL